ncbi:hypothetical protein GCM10022251_19660 [Phytohabitans flavus]|uniref:Helix-turn-helix domain-containing protein n=1 Tax=Phytohabitans flavus TaxID=1076124 RepID=A0A6F8XZI2_9ACTN|nr:helix-turn-helix domain-containing protein [Phytohabitans flavus]BCB79141.1 hypothetical protein Pflav_055510 [Phytohabitans flavus]
MTVHLTPALAAHLAVALRRHLRTLRADGVPPPAALVALADALLSGQERPKLGCWCGCADAGTTVAPGAAATVDAATAAGLLGISVRSLRRLAASGQIPQVRIGRRVRYRLADLERFLEARRVRRAG